MDRAAAQVASPPGFPSRSGPGAGRWRLGLAALVVWMLAAGVPGAPRMADAATATDRTLTMTLFYEGVLFIKVLQVRSDYVLTPSHYRAGARVETSGAVAAVKRFRLSATAQGGISGARLAPQEFTSTDGRKRRVVRFADPKMRGVADPLTRMLQIGLSTGATPCVGREAFYDGKQRYDLIFSPLRVGSLTPQIQRLGLNRPVTCALAFRPVSGLGKGPGGSLRGPSTATFAWSPRARLWVLTGMSIGTVLGAGRIDLTNIQVSATR
jgi:hypothetical protein